MLGGERMAWGWGKGEEKGDSLTWGPAFVSAEPEATLGGQQCWLWHPPMPHWWPELALLTLSSKSPSCPTCGRCCLAVQGTCKFNSFWGGLAPRSAQWWLGSRAPNPTCRNPPCRHTGTPGADTCTGHHSGVVGTEALEVKQPIICI